MGFSFWLLGVGFKPIQCNRKQTSKTMQSSTAIPPSPTIRTMDIAELEVFTTDKDRAQQFLSIAKRYTDFSQLTTPMGDVKKDIAAMEAALKKLDEQERKYSAELESALQLYRELEAQAAEFDAEELTDARLELRPGMDRSTVSRIQTDYDTQYSPFTMAEARQDVSKLLPGLFCFLRILKT